MRPIAIACALLACAPPSVRAQDADPAQLPRVEVVRTAPIGGPLPRDWVPGNVQQVDSERIRELGPLNLPNLLGAHLGSVNINETQGNPYQIEVNYRGFSASPLLGVPQGLSVYVDGVRVNEAFGDVVNWDLIPRGAIADLTLIPGSNPLFGLNTLGGALALRMKRGDTDAGTAAEIGVGSFGRIALEASHGRALGDGAHLFVAAAGFDEDGWRDYSPSRIGQVFVRGGRSVGGTGWDLALTHARTDLVGNGLLPQTLLDVNRESIYTRPDQTKNQMTMLTFNGEVRLDDQNALAATAYLRRLDTDTLNGDLNDDYDPPLVTETGVENRTGSNQRAGGIALQWNGNRPGLRLMAGVSHDQARTEFEQSEAEGELDPTRGVVPEEEAEVNAAISGKTRTESLYASVTWSLTPQWHVTASARYNYTRVTTVDDGRIELGLPTTLDADATYKRFNPALGAVFQADPALTVYANLSQGNRAPSPVELGCSDPANPCVLPNALQSDPPLAQVVAQTFEAGLRGRIADGLRWNASLFRTVNRDDILFVSNTLAAGYFKNFGRTRRQGVELGLQGVVGPFDLAASYGLVDATYESAACIVAESNSSAETSAACTGEGEIEVRPGDRIPNIPRHTLKLDAGWRPSPAWRIGANVVAQSAQYARGNENNAHRPDGVDFSGEGSVPAFVVVNLDARWRFASGWTLGAAVNNLSDRRHSTGSALAENAFDASGALMAPADWRNEQFHAPAAPRSFWVTLQYAFGAAP
jgi:outer membrane receptor protein involved in Fe transport